MINVESAGGLLKVVGGLRTPVLVFLGFCVLVGVGLYVQQTSGCPSFEAQITTNETKMFVDCELVAVAFNTRAVGWTKDERARSQRAHFRVDMIQGEDLGTLLRERLPIPKDWKT